MPTRNFTGFGGLSLVASEYGSPDLPSVVFLPGGGQHRDVWEDAARLLADAGRHVVTLDLRGHGDSARPQDARYDLESFVGDLQCVLKSLPSRPVVVGASLGGWIATVALGEGEPDLASGLVIVDAAAKIDQEQAVFMGEALRRHASRDNDAPYDPRFLGKMDLVEVASRVEAATKKLRLPTLFVRGEKSPLSSANSIAGLAEMVPDAEFIEIRDAGHLVAVDQPDAFNAAIVDFLERRVPRQPPEFVAGSDQRTLRDALGCFATGITVVTTTGADGTMVGLTANSFTSVSLDPPLLLVCPAKNAHSMQILHDTNHFAVNVLHIGQQPVSNVFASKAEDRFADLDWETWDHGVPIIKNSLASFECEKYAEYDGGDHIILVGQVTRVRFEPQRDPLLYFRGKYRRLHFA